MGLRRGPRDGPSGITVVETILGDIARSETEKDDDDDDVESLSFEADSRSDDEPFLSLSPFFLAPDDESEELSFLMLSMPTEDEDDSTEDDVDVEEDADAVANVDDDEEAFLGVFLAAFFLTSVMSIVNDGTLISASERTFTVNMGESEYFEDLDLVIVVASPLSMLEVDVVVDVTESLDFNDDDVDDADDADALELDIFSFLLISFLYFLFLFLFYLSNKLYMYSL